MSDPERVFVGLSGGVDSAVTAALLQRAGAAVTGVFIKGWYPPGMPCTWAQDRRDAMRVAAHLRIPFATLDASAAYKAGVIDYLLAEYGAGRTPNPDAMCNRDVKFGAFVAFARAHGADAIATGHYARAEGGRLLRGIDPGKDQSYFLWAVPKDALAYARFPLGAMRKADTRALAARLGLPVAVKRDSQGICFLGSVSVDDFLRAEFGSEPGEAVDAAGTRVGTHDGVLLHTPGSRVALADAAPGPWFVVAKDVSANRLVVSCERSPLPASADLTLSGSNWFEPPAEGQPVEAQYRYHGPRVPGTLHAAGARFRPGVPLPEPAAPGQSLVVYAGDRVLGGGAIV